MIKKILSLLLMLAAVGFSSQCWAAEGSVTITSPASGAKLDSMVQNKISYEVVPGPRGDHVHLYVDGKEMAVIRQLKGSYTMDTLAPGKREICIKVVNKGHTPIGVQQCVSVTVD